MTVRQLISQLRKYRGRAPVYVRLSTSGPEGGSLYGVEEVRQVIGDDPRWPGRVFVDGVGTVEEHDPSHPDDCDQGPPYVEVEPDHCLHCGRPFRISESILPIGKAWVFVCFCGVEILCTPVAEVM
jgi:hypothetical protein